MKFLVTLLLSCWLVSSIFAQSRDRMDERYDIIRMAHDHRYKYIRNYEPLKTFYQYMNTPEKGATMQGLRRGHEAGTLRLETAYFFSPVKPVEELYDTRKDPHELHNLAVDPEYDPILARLRKAHLEWVKRTRDTGLIAEPILVEREKAIGHRYGILRQRDDDSLSDRVADTAVAVSQGLEALPVLKAVMKDGDAVVRYWGAVGIGNVGLATGKATELMETALKDSYSVVRISAARALARMGKPMPALPVLTKGLQDGEQVGAVARGYCSR